MKNWNGKLKKELRTIRAKGFSTVIEELKQHMSAKTIKPLKTN